MTPGPGRTGCNTGKIHRVELQDVSHVTGKAGQ